MTTGCVTTAVGMAELDVEVEFTTVGCAAANDTDSAATGADELDTEVEFTTVDSDAANTADSAATGAGEGEGEGEGDGVGDDLFSFTAARTGSRVPPSMNVFKTSSSDAPSLMKFRPS